VVLFLFCLLLSLYVPACAAESGSTRAVDALVQLAGERVATADRVAAAKWGTDKAIDDPAREAQVLDDTVKRAAGMGVDTDATVRIFRDQIEANKLVQRGLHREWQAAPAEAPRERPDLSKQVRPALDRIGAALLIAIRDARPLLESGQCQAAVERSRQRATTSLHLDPLHQAGLARALQHVCR